MFLPKPLLAGGGLQGILKSLGGMPALPAFQVVSSLNNQQAEMTVHHFAYSELPESEEVAAPSFGGVSPSPTAPHHSSQPASPTPSLTLWQAAHSAIRETQEAAKECCYCVNSDSTVLDRDPWEGTSANKPCVHSGQAI